VSFRMQSQCQSTSPSQSNGSLSGSVPCPLEPFFDHNVALSIFNDKSIVTFGMGIMRAINSKINAAFSEQAPEVAKLTSAAGVRILQT
jgi:hypothetical protein